MKIHVLSAGLTLAALTLLTPPAQAKNILVIMLDDVGVDKVSSYAADYPGYTPAFLPDTQAIDSVANAGLRFTRAWATPLCSPTRASFQTGKYPFRHGVGTALGDGVAGLDIAAQSLMLAQSFSSPSQGYQTGMFGKWHVGTTDVNGVEGYPADPTFFVEPHPSLAGWDRFYGIYDGYPGMDLPLLGIDRSFTDWPRVSWLSSGTGYYTAHETHNMTDRTSKVALDWISQQSGDWLAVVAFSAPHSPDTASSSWQYGDGDIIPGVIGPRYRTPGLSCLATSSCGDEAKAVYQGLLEHVDLEIEDLLNGIDEAVMKETLIIVLGDNGTPDTVQESLFAVSRGKGTVYENGIRVPMVVAHGATWFDGTAGAIVTPGRVVEAGVNTMDAFQAIHNYALAFSVAGVDSRTFTDCFATTDIFCGRVGPRYGYSETFVANGSISSAKIAVRYGNDKMIATYDPINACMEETDTFYETATDPFELAPQSWVGVRADRLRDYFTNLHTPVASSWAYANGGALVPFCP